MTSNRFASQSLPIGCTLGPQLIPLHTCTKLTAVAARADKKSINSFHYWLLIFNYEAPCNFQHSQIPPIKQVLQVGEVHMVWKVPLRLSGAGAASPYAHG